MSCRLFSNIVLISMCLVMPVQTFAQSAGLSARGGSITRNRTEPPTRPDHKTEPMFYRRIVNRLGLDFADLEESYWTARVRNPKLDFPTLVKGQIAVEMKAANSSESASQKLVDALAQSHNKLLPAFQKAFSLTSAEANQLEKTVNERYKNAARSSASLP